MDLLGKLFEDLKDFKMSEEEAKRFSKRFLNSLKRRSYGYQQESNKEII